LLRRPANSQQRGPILGGPSGRGRRGVPGGGGGLWRQEPLARFEQMRGQEVKTEPSRCEQLLAAAPGEHGGTREQPRSKSTRSPDPIKAGAEQSQAGHHGGVKPSRARSDPRGLRGDPIPMDNNDGNRPIRSSSGASTSGPPPVKDENRRWWSRSGDRGKAAAAGVGGRRPE
jgi:hypothetical protein